MVWGDAGHSALMGSFAAVLANSASGGTNSIDLWSNIGNVGFPIAVATFLLLKLSPRLEELTAAVRELTTEVRHLQAVARERDE